MRISAREACVKPHFTHGVMKSDFLSSGSCTGPEDIFVCKNKEGEGLRKQRELGYLKETEDKRKPGLCLE